LGAKGGLPIGRRRAIGSVLVIAILVAVVSVMSLARRPVLGATVTRSQGGPRPAVNPSDRVVHPPVEECLSSTAFIDYASDARGRATPRAAVRDYVPGARDLRVHMITPEHASVEQFKGTIKVAAYEVFRTGNGWLVVQADSYEPCDSAEGLLATFVATPGFARIAS
jgi:hypothetical protein